MNYTIIQYKNYLCLYFKFKKIIFYILMCQTSDFLTFFNHGIFNPSQNCQGIFIYVFLYTGVPQHPVCKTVLDHKKDVIQLTLQS